MNKPWYVDLYEDSYFLQCCVPLIPSKMTAMDINFIMATLTLPEGAKVLDLCCGHGRHSIPLAQRGLAVTGVDLSRSALDQAHAGANAVGLSTINWICSDMRTIPFTNYFDACINWFTSFGYLPSDEEDQTVFRAVNRALRPGGRFLIDLTNHAWLMRNFQPYARLSTPTGETIIEEREFDLSTGRNNVRISFFLPGGKRKESRQSLRVYTLPELTRMLSLAGFHICGIWGDTDGSACQLTSPRMIVLSKKPV